jgi:hypothetical protein
LKYTKNTVVHDEAIINCPDCRARSEGRDDAVFMAEAVLARIEQWGIEVFRVHPKGQVCFVYIP